MADQTPGSNQPRFGKVAYDGTKCDSSFPMIQLSHYHLVRKSLAIDFFNILLLKTAYF